MNTLHKDCQFLSNVIVKFVILLLFYTFIIFAINVALQAKIKTENHKTIEINFEYRVF